MMKVPSEFIYCLPLLKGFIREREVFTLTCYFLNCRSRNNKVLVLNHIIFLKSTVTIKCFKVSLTLNNSFHLPTNSIMEGTVLTSISYKNF